MEQIEARTKQPTHLTYRAVGSTTGTAEFINSYGQPANDFGSGDLPLNKTVYDAFTTAGVGVVHLPVLLGAVSFFHSVQGVAKLNLSPCLLARIFSRDITVWNHPDIIAFSNPALENLGAMEDLPINVVHRVRGSSSTDSVTNYLMDACPDYWGADMVGSKITWPEGTNGCEGSGGMTTCIKETPGTIGYIDAGHGIGAGLVEIELENIDGTIQSSEEAAMNGGIASAEAGVLPASPDMDFSQVSLLNRPGKYTWPIVQMTYVYVRKDLTYFNDPQEAGLVVAFLKTLFDVDYIQQCADDYGFTIPSGSVKAFGLQGIGMLEVSNETMPWTFESSTQPIAGQDQYVISSKRARISDLERSSLTTDTAALVAENEMLKMQLNAVANDAGMTDSQESQLKAALAMSTLCFIFLSISFIAYFFRFCTSGKE
eukprot:CAMPEP_0198140618 /NCGR_PEP_ID=MMETSP1443-20131203/3759_1 /TAXON_ID=186043 /ORGANISM="Entomoneis sp., Strain CCMP2396" /LENGTH=427 /DNA_ID=CAMNT_0043803109 /DNA_START=186 /DNA_END=1469 /DNA_ORIENTATION=-